MVRHSVVIHRFISAFAPLSRCLGGHHREALYAMPRPKTSRAQLAFQYPTNMRSRRRCTLAAQVYTVMHHCKYSCFSSVCVGVVRTRSGPYAGVWALHDRPYGTGPHAPGLEGAPLWLSTVCLTNLRASNLPLPHIRSLDARAIDMEELLPQIFSIAAFAHRCAYTTSACLTFMTCSLPTSSPPTTPSDGARRRAQREATARRTAPEDGGALPATAGARARAPRDTTPR